MLKPSWLLSNGQESDQLVFFYRISLLTKQFCYYIMYL